MIGDNDGNRPPRRLLWLPPPLYAAGHRPDNPSLGYLIWDASGRVLRWTGSEWVDDLGEWLLVRYMTERERTREPAEIEQIEQADWIEQIEQAEWEVFRLAIQLRDASQGSDEAIAAERRLRGIAMHFAGQDGWQESWAI